MSTAASSTSPHRWRAVRDVGHLLRFRAATITPRRRIAVAAAFVALTLLASTVPAYLPGAGGRGRAVDVLLLLPSGWVAFLVLALVSAVASGGGRELVPRDQLVAYPVSPTTDHLGALLLAPLNIGWLLQSWLLLGSTAFALGPAALPVAQPGTLLWIAAATAAGQAVAWALEGVRRLPRGVAAIRLLALAVLVAGGLLQLTGRLAAVLDEAPTRWLVAGLVEGVSWHWAATLLVLCALLVAAVVLGALPAQWAARLQPREELLLETGHQRVRRPAATDFGAMVRLDRGSVWRAVPIRRGLLVLSVGPGLVSLAGDLPWDRMTILPGLVASGGALLFGVNVWCLETRGVLWRESLPVPPAAVFWARAWVLTEFLVTASAITLAIACLRAGMPSPEELAALVCTWAVVLAQVVTASLRWSLRAPYAVDLRSARATPAPPVAMVGYSTKLALGTTLTSLVFTGLAAAPHWTLSVVVSAPFLLWSAFRGAQAHRGWTTPTTRARVVMAVAG